MVDLGVNRTNGRRVERASDVARIDTHKVALITGAEKVISSSEQLFMRGQSQVR